MCPCRFENREPSKVTQAEKIEGAFSDREEPSRRKRSQWMKSLGGLVLSALLIAWIVQSTDWRDVYAELRGASYWALFPATAIFFLHFFIRAIRWRSFLPRGKSLPLGILFDSIMVGNLANFLLPLRAGEFVRPYMLSRRARPSFASGFASVVVERFFDLSAVLIAFAVLLLWFQNFPRWVYQGAITLGLISIALMIFIVVGSFVPLFVLKVFKAVVQKVFSHRPRRLERHLIDFLKGARVLRKNNNFVKVLFFTALVWATTFLLYFVLLYLVPVPRSFLLSVSVSVIIALAVAAPSVPGFVGVYQTACIAGFSLFGVSTEVAVAYSIITHALHYVIFVPYGLFALSRAGLSFSELRNRKGK